MFLKTIFRPFAVIILLSACMAGCSRAVTEVTPVPMPTLTEAAAVTTPTAAETIAVLPTFSPQPLSPTLAASNTAFPAVIDPAKRYLFYLHGKIIEDQGIPAVSAEYGEYQYGAILETLGGHGFVVISEQRPRNADVVTYGRKIAGQVAVLLNAGVPAGNITVVGASKGAWIAIQVSHFLENKDVNYVILAICHPDNVAELIESQTFLHGNVLSIYDSSDEFAGSCQELFAFSAGKGISRYDEVVLNVGTGHGILYQPLDEWVIPVVQWAGE